MRLVQLLTYGCGVTTMTRIAFHSALAAELTLCGVLYFRPDPEAFVDDLRQLVIADYRGRDVLLPAVGDRGRAGLIAI